MLQEKVIYTWTNGPSLINVDFDSSGSSVVASGSNFKVATGLNNPTVPGLGVCTASNFTVANFNAVTAGMTFTQASQAIGCQVSSNTVLGSKVIYAWTINSSSINVDFDPTGTTVTGDGGSFKVASNLQFPNPPSGPACTAANFTFANFNAITVGMTVDQVNKTIGCQTNGNTVLQSNVVFTWINGASLINVDFDPAGTLATSFGGSFKVAAGLI